MNEKFREMMIRHEALKLKVYDDATGKELKPGMTLKGHPTIGIGRALDVNGITRDEAFMLFEADLDKVRSQAATLSWFGKLTEARQDVVLSMIFNLGFNGFMKFKRTIDAIERGDYSMAAKYMMESLWARQVKGRAVELSRMMETGEYGT